MAMSSLSMMEANLPPGFRFHPRDEELVCDYLTKKISGDSSTIGNLCDVFPTIIDVDLNKCEPWELPEVACVGSKEWYFFNLRDRKYATGQRTNRATESGYWKATGKDRHITRQGMLVGMRKTLVFYEGRAPKGKKTEWVMHEFRMESPEDVSKCYAKEDWVLCRVFYKSRGLISKPSPNSTTNYNEDTSSSSLPPLMESYLTFGHGQTPMTLESYHHHHHHHHDHEQVPCFSINPFQNPNLAMAGPLVPTVERSMVIKSQAHDNMDSSLNQLDHDKKVMRDVLYQLTKLEGNQKRDPLLPHLGEGSIGGSFLYDNGLSFMW